MTITKAKLNKEERLQQKTTRKNVEWIGNESSNNNKKTYQIPSARIINRTMLASHILMDITFAVYYILRLVWLAFEWWHYAGRHCDDFYNLLMLCHSFYRQNQDASMRKRKCSREYHPKVKHPVCNIHTHHQ